MRTMLHCFFNELLKEPPLTEVEVYELAEIHPDGREAFYKKVKREWYAKILIGTLALYIVEYTVFSISSSWLYAAPVLPVLYAAHRLKWQRNTNYGALARAKLAQPREWPSWKRRTDTAVEREKIQRNKTIKNTGGNNTEWYRDTSETQSINTLYNKNSIEKCND